MERIAEGLGKIVESGQLAGAATLIWRDGRPAHTACVGVRDLESGLPVEPDTLFRIASMSKSITSVAALMLHEEGQFALEDPIAQWAPEFSEMRVLRSIIGPLADSDPAGRPITFADLLTHRSGLTYGGFHGATPIAQAYREALGGDIDTVVAPDDWIARLARLPLIDQPGGRFHYGHSTDLLGLLVARMDGAPLGNVLARRIFQPLGMIDTAFTVPAAKALRCARPCGFDDGGQLMTLAAGPGDSFMAERAEGLTYVSGGQGLWSTLRDYLAFARLFLGGGTVDGVQLLRPETMALMMANQLTMDQRATSMLLGMPIFAAGHGFGLGVAVVVEPEKADVNLCGGNRGAVGWPGGFGGWWRADPTDHSILIFLSHNMVELPQLANGIGLGVYDAVAQFQSLAGAASHP